VRRSALVLLFACGSHDAAPPATPDPPAAQSVRDGLQILCSSRWNGQLYGNKFLRWIPDELHERISNNAVTKLVNALTDPDVRRAEMFDAFVAENHVEHLACPLRDRLPSWPNELPIIPANKGDRTPPL
jgi:hypothetical protein